MYTGRWGEEEDSSRPGERGKSGLFPRIMVRIVSLECLARELLGLPSVMFISIHEGQLFCYLVGWFLTCSLADLAKPGAALQIPLYINSYDRSVSIFEMLSRLNGLS